MRIAIDGVFFQLHKGGIGRVWISILQEWVQSAFAARIIILDRDGTFPRIDGYTYRTIPVHSYADLEGDQQMLEEVCFMERVTLFVSTYYTRPFNLPTILMVYDLIPEVLGADLSQSKWIEKASAINYARSFVAISHSTAEDLCRYYPHVAQRNINVIHLAADPLFKPAPRDAIDSFKKLVGIDRDYFLHVGSRASYKNPLLLYKAFSQLSAVGNYQLVFTGDVGWDAELTALVQADRVVMAGQLTDDQLAVAYSGAVALVYPSYYEGFGLPVLEALSCGCPVIVHRTSSLPEVGGDALYYLPSDFEDDLLKAMLATESKSLRALLIQRGLQRAKWFSWQKTAEEFMNVLTETTG
jgi:glycosyltransferase involved in cell wall biosynthesis